MCKKIRGVVALTAMITILLIVFVFSGCSKAAKDNKEITISAAASLKEPLEEIVSEFEKQRNVKVNINLGGSGTLRRQIEQGSPVDIFFPAGKEYMDTLEQKNLIEKGSRIDVLSNSIVLIISDKFKAIETLGELKDIQGKLALGETKTVPAGKYAKESLVKLGLWDSLQHKAVYAKDVKEVVRYVEQGEVQAGIVYESDTVNLKYSWLVLNLPEDTYERIVYPVAIARESKNKEISEDFLDYLKSSEGKKVFIKYKFVAED
jgi:molybdate transport system substrate-binding protein